MIHIENFHYHAASGDSLATLSLKVTQIMSSILDLVAAVTEQTSKVESLKVFVTGLEQQINDVLANSNLSAADQAALDAVFVGVNANTASISAAIDNDPATV